MHVAIPENRGVCKLQMSTLLLRKSVDCQLKTLELELEFCAKLSEIGDKFVCFDEKTKLGHNIQIL